MYEATRHNVGWWLLDHLADAWGFEKYRATGVSRVADGEVDGLAVRLLKPWTFMNRSGLAMADLGTAQGFDVGRDLLVVVDDVALDVGRIRFRPGGSAGTMASSPSRPRSGRVTTRGCGSESANRRPDTTSRRGCFRRSRLRRSNVSWTSSPS